MLYFFFGHPVYLVKAKSDKFNKSVCYKHWHKNKRLKWKLMNTTNCELASPDEPVPDANTCS